MAFPKYQITLNPNTKPVDEKIRRKLDKKYANLQEMVDAGWTQAELEALIQAPRTRPTTGGNMPCIDGVMACYSLMTAQEKEGYAAYKKGLSGTSSAARTSTNAAANAEQLSNWFKLVTACAGNEQATALIANLMPEQMTVTLTRDKIVAIMAAGIEL